MPTLTGADYLFGSAIASAFDRARVAVRLLPCGRCGAEGPHWRVVVREGVATAVCNVCDPEVRQDAAEDHRDMDQSVSAFHSPITPFVGHTHP